MGSDPGWGVPGPAELVPTPSPKTLRPLLVTGPASWLSQTACSLLSPLVSVTDCNVNHTGHSHCTCRPGYRWSTRLCSREASCLSPDHDGLHCDCQVFSHSVPGYCQLLPPGEEGWELGKEELSVLFPEPVSLPTGPSPLLVQMGREARSPSRAQALSLRSEEQGWRKSPRVTQTKAESATATPLCSLGSL